MTSQEMIITKYGAIRTFYNQLAQQLDLENQSAKNFKEIVNQQLEYILPFCTRDQAADTSAIKQALDILEKSSFIPYAREINGSLADKGDEEEIGKILVGIFYELRVRQPAIVQKVIQAMNVECQLEMIHVIRFLETREDWPIAGTWAAILRTSLPVELQEEWEDHENSILGDITNAEPDRRRQSIIMRTPLTSRTPGKQRRRMTTHGSPLLDTLYSPIGKARMQIEELEKQVAYLIKKNLELHHSIESMAEATDQEHEALFARVRAPSVNHEMNRRMEEQLLDVRLRLANVELEKAELESTRKRLERELDASQLNSFEFRQRCNEQAADLTSLADEKDKIAKERDSLKESIAKLIDDYDKRVKAVAALEETQNELSEKLRKTQLENKELDESYSNVVNEILEVKRKRDEYVNALRTKYETEVDALKKSLDTAVAEAVQKSKAEKEELESRLAEVTATSEKAVTEAEARVLKFKEMTEKAKRDSEGFFKASLRAKEEIEKLQLELVDRLTTIAELSNDLDEQERVCFTHETELAAAQEQVKKLESQKIARRQGALALQNLPFSLDKVLPMPSFELVAPTTTTKSVKSHPDYLNVSVPSIDTISLGDTPLTIQDLFIEPPQINCPRPSLATVFTARSETPLRSEFAGSIGSMRPSKRSVTFADVADTKSRQTLPSLGRTDEENESSLLYNTPRQSLTKSARKSISRMFKHHRKDHN